VNYGTSLAYVIASVQSDVILSQLQQHLSHNTGLRSNSTLWIS